MFPKFYSGLSITSTWTPAKQKSISDHQIMCFYLFRALARGTLLAVGGCSVLFYSLWKLSGARDLAEFRQKAGNVLPRIPKSNPPVGRTEFSGLNDFLQYVIDRDKEEKELKMKDENKGSI
jgi:hypothetical protein